MRHSLTLCLATAAFTFASSTLAGTSIVAREETVPGKLTTTEDQALYGVAILRAAPDLEAEQMGKLIAGSRVTVYPETSPRGWWYIEMIDGSGASTQGFVPRSFVSMNRGPFKDVPGDHWAAGALSRLKTSGDLSGYQGGVFHGEKAFTRYEMAVLLDRYMGRLRKARSRIEETISKIPMQANLGGHDAKTLDEVIQNLERLRQEEESLKGAMAGIRAKVEVHQRRLDAMHDEFASVVHHDKQQDQRLDELARTATKLTGEVEAIRSMGKTFAKAGAGVPKDTVKLAANIVRIKELAQRAETLEAKVAALESRDRLARLLQREEASRAQQAPVLAIRDDAPGITDGRM